MIKKSITSTYNKIGQIFKNHRMQLNYSIKQLVYVPISEGILAKGWISERSISNFEKGHNMPNLISLNKLATAYQMDLIDLIVELEPYL